MPQAVRNIAILAHVDAGKTTLSERILFAAGEVRRPGKVEEGLATMDYMPEEKERGITIESGVAHFEWKDTWFNFIDTPGHVDFGAEVDERDDTRGAVGQDEPYDGLVEYVGSFRLFQEPFDIVFTECHARIIVKLPC